MDTLRRPAVGQGRRIASTYSTRLTSNAVIRLTGSGNAPMAGPEHDMKTTLRPASVGQHMVGLGRLHKVRVAQAITLPALRSAFDHSTPLPQLIHARTEPAAEPKLPRPQNNEALFTARRDTQARAIASLTG
jgi:hypothetical protein